MTVVWRRDVTPCARVLQGDEPVTADKDLDELIDGVVEAAAAGGADDTDDDKVLLRRVIVDQASSVLPLLSPPKRMSSPQISLVRLANDSP